MGKEETERGRMESKVWKRRMVEKRNGKDEIRGDWIGWDGTR